MRTVGEQKSEIFATANKIDSTSVRINSFAVLTAVCWFEAVRRVMAENDKNDQRNELVFVAGRIGGHATGHYAISQFVRLVRFALVIAGLCMAIGLVAGLTRVWF